MHELTLTGSVVDTIAERVGAATIVRVRLEIGRVSGVLADAVRFCFDVVAAGTILDGARLEVDEPAGRARCRDCGTEFEIADLLAECRCGGVDLAIVAGDRFLIREVEVVGDVRDVRV